MKRKLISLLILAMLLLSLFPCAAFAEEPAEAPAEEPAETPAEEPEEEAAEPERRWPVKADDLICFGVYNDTPVTWVVLDPDQTNMGTEGVFLLTQGLWDSTHVVFDESSTLWEGSLGQECAPSSPSPPSARRRAPWCPIPTSMRTPCTSTPSPGGRWI